MRRFLAVLAVIASLVVLAVPASADPGTNRWKVYTYNPSGMAFASAIATDYDDGFGFAMASEPDNALLATDHPSYRGTLLGDIEGKTLTVTLRVDASAGATFTYWGEGTPSNPCGTPASARFYFYGNTNGPFDPQHYWWSNPVAVRFADLTSGAVTIETTVSLGEWSDWDGHMNTYDAGHETAFAAAASDVQLFGLSFGGGCFFENGVGVSSGSATFHVTGISAQ